MNFRFKETNRIKREAEKKKKKKERKEKKKKKKNEEEIIKHEKKKKIYILVIPKITGRENQFCFEQPLVKNASIFEIFYEVERFGPNLSFYAVGLFFFHFFY